MFRVPNIGLDSNSHFMHRDVHQLTLMYREKMTFAVSFPSVSALIFHLLLGSRQSFV